MKKRALYVVLCAFLCVFGGISAITGAQEGNVIVPNVEGISQDIAIQILQTAGLQPQVSHKRDRLPFIVQQEPKPGLLVPLGTTITISTEIIQTAPAKVVLPEETQQISPETDSQKTVDTQGTSSIQLHVPGASAKSAGTSQAALYLPWYPEKFRLQQQPTARVFQQQAASQHPNNVLKAIPVSEKQGVSILVTADGWQKGWPARSGRTEPVPVPVSQTGVTITHIPTTVATSVTVPHVIRLQQRDAIAAINRAGLSGSIVEWVQDPHLKAGLVVQQSPVSGSVVPTGTYVNLRVVK